MKQLCFEMHLSQFDRHKIFLDLFLGQSRGRRLGSLGLSFCGSNRELGHGQESLTNFIAFKVQSISTSNHLRDVF